MLAANPSDHLSDLLSVCVCASSEHGLLGWLERILGRTEERVFGSKMQRRVLSCSLMPPKKTNVHSGRRLSNVGVLRRDMEVENDSL